MSLVPPLTCIALFETEGEALALAGNAPLLLGDADSVFCITSGRVDVFSVTVDAGAPTGARHHFFTAEEGDLLFGMDLDRYGEGQGLLAVGMVGTRVRRLNIARLRAHAGEAAFMTSLAPMVDRWVSGLSTGVARTIVPAPRADVQIEPGDSSTLSDSQRVRARKAVTWVEVVSGAALLIGMEDFADLPPGTRLPLTTATWLQALGPLTIDGADTSHALANDGGWLGLETFYGALFRCEFFNTRLAAADELNRLREKAGRDRRVRARALQNLVEVVTGRVSGVSEAHADDPLLSAMHIVGRTMGFEFKAPPKPNDDDPAEVDRVEEILRASRVHGRTVMLTGEWWTSVASPLLAFVAEDLRPVAIRPVRGGCELWDSASATLTRLTPALAGALAPKAYTFYRPLPSRALTPWDLVTFGLKGGGWDIARLLLVGIAGGLLAMAAPYFTGRLVDSVIPEAARHELVQIAVVLAVVGLTTTTFEIVRSLTIVRLETRMGTAVQPALWDRLLALPISFFRQFAAGDLALRVGNIETIRTTLSGTAASVVLTSLFSGFLLVQMLAYSWALGLLGLGLVLVALAVTVSVGAIKVRRERDVLRLEGRLSALALQLVTGIAKLRVAGGEGRAFAQWARDFASKKSLAMRAGRLENVLLTFSAVFPVLASVLVFWVTMTFVMDGGGMTSGGFIAFNAAFALLLTQMLLLGNTAMGLLVILPLYERARPILDAVPEVDVTKADPGDLTGQIDVEHVTFRYTPDGPVVLNDVSIHIAAGEFVAIVGPSGSGKSSLLRLLLGLDAPEAGAVYFNGKDLAQLDVAAVRRRMGVVMQFGKIRPGSISENIIGSGLLTVDDAWAAARLAGFEEDVRQMPMGMQTILQQGGLTLSGGQRQRLMIARAIVSRPRILLFDEATSALDNRTQEIVTQSLQELQATRIAVAHRLSTIQGADRIYVMDRGRVVQAGTYAELSSQPGLFADLIRRQVA